jgi:hypothetical protein
MPTKERIALQTIILHAAEDSNSFELLLNALSREGVDDIYIIKRLVCGKAASTDKTFWYDCLTGCDLLVVLVSPAFLKNSAFGTIDGLLEQCKLVAPILLEVTDKDSSHLFSFQSLPYPPVKDWPIQENVWTNVAIQLRKLTFDMFWWRLNSYYACREQVVVRMKYRERRKAVQSQTERSAFLQEHKLWLNRQKEHDELRRVVEVPGFRKVLRYPYQHYAWTFGMGEATKWVFLASLTALGVHLEPAISVSAVIKAALGPGAVLVLLAYKRTVRVVKRNSCGYNKNNEDISVTDRGNWIFRRALFASGITILWVLAIVFASRHWVASLSPISLGIIAGLGAYVLTSRRIPRVLLVGKLHTPTEARFRPNTISVEMPVIHDRSRIGNIGSLPAAEPVFVRSLSGTRRFSLKSFIKSFLESCMVSVLGLVLFFLGVEIRINSLVSGLTAAIAMEVVMGGLFQKRLFRRFIFSLWTRSRDSPSLASPTAWGGLSFGLFVLLYAISHEWKDIGKAFFDYLPPAFMVNLLRRWFHNSLSFSQRATNSKANSLE